MIMESVMNNDVLLVSEIELIYRPKIKASQRIKITTSSTAASLLRQLWDTNRINFIEQFKVLLLNRSNKVLGIVEISCGGITGTIVDAKLVFVAALKAGACNIILSHNHPSGSLQPSTADKEVTRKLQEGATCLDMKLVDHIIITNEGYFSFADEGLI
jgi:DNA repair protein RadC